MRSAGLFVLPGLAFAQAGKAVVLAYALAAMAVIPAESRAAAGSAKP